MNKQIIAILGMLVGAQIAFADPGRGSSGRPPQGGSHNVSSVSEGGSNGRTTRGGGVGRSAGGSNG